MFLFFAWTSRGFKISRHTSAQVARDLKTLGSLLKHTVRKVEFVGIKALEIQSRDAEEKVNPLVVENVVLRVRREELERKLAESRILGVKPQIKSGLKCPLSLSIPYRTRLLAQGWKPMGLIRITQDLNLTMHF